MSKLQDGPSSIGARLRLLGYQKYADYLASEHWQHVKQRYRESDRPQKCSCGARATDLHHLTYVRLGREKLADLEALCRDCHRKRHRKPKLKPKVRTATKRPPNKKRKGCKGPAGPDWTELYREAKP